MIFLSKRFFGQVRQYAQLEDKMRVDYSEQILRFAQFELENLLQQGVGQTLAIATINGALGATVKAYPVQLPTVSE